MVSAWQVFATATAGPVRLAERWMQAAPSAVAPRAAGQHRGAARRRRWPQGLVLAVPALAELVAGGYRLGGPALWRQEGESLEVARRPLGGILTLLGHTGVTHGLYYLLLHVVIGTFGTSPVALRLPSLLAMVAACMLTAALGRRLARQSGIPSPSAAGLLAGLLLAVLPLTTFYAQDAGPGALAMLAAVAATYCLVRAAAGDGRAWWAGYSVSLVLAGLLQEVTLLLVAAHGVSLLVAWVRARSEARAFPRPGRLAGRVMPAELRALAADAPAGAAAPALGGWLLAAGIAVLALVPLAWATVRQPNPAAGLPGLTLAEIGGLAARVAGRPVVVPVVAVLAAVAVVADAQRGAAGRTMAVLAGPWLAVPPAVLFVASADRPVLDAASVLFCLPALALLTAAGLVWVIWQTGEAAARRRLRGTAVLSAGGGVAAAAAVVALLAGPQISVRQTARTDDDFPAVAAVVSRVARPGAAVVYLPADARIVALTDPAPFGRLRDVAELASPLASASLWGRSAPGSTLAGRLAGVRWVWTVQLSPDAQNAWTGPAPAWPARMRALRLVRQWAIGSVELSLYRRLSASGRRAG